MNDEDFGNIERMEEDLYSRKAPKKIEHRDTRVHGEHEEIRGDWEVSAKESSPFILAPNAESSIMKKIFIFALLFFGASLLLAALIFFRGTNFVSANNISIVAKGPVAVAAGETVSFEITIANENTSMLDNAELKIVYPEGSEDPTRPGEGHSRETISLGSVPAGGKKIQKIETILFGEEQSKKTIEVAVEYRVAGSNAIFEKKKIIEVAISSTPLSLIIKALDEVNSDQEVVLEIEVASNTTNTIQDVLLKAEYPFGFIFATSEPKAGSRNLTWKLGDIPSGSKKKVLIKGTMQGQQGEVRTFRFSVGNESKKNPGEVSPVFLTTSHEMNIKRPFVGVDILVNGKSASVVNVVPLGTDARVDLSYVNNLPVGIADVEIVAILSGSIINRQGIRAERGFYNSSDNSIRWDKTTNQSLSNLESGASGRLSFTIPFLGVSEALQQKIQDLKVNLAVSVQARRAEEGNVPEKILAATSEIKAVSPALVAQRLLFSEGPFTNNGPVPPKADVSTTYTVTWTASSALGDIGQALVTAQLPTYVSWLGIKNPLDEDLTFNKTQGKVTWNVGKIPAGAGYSSSPRSVSFQISLLPSLSQVGQSPIVVHEAVLTGRDIFANVEVSAQGSAITTKLSSDPQFRDGDDRVRN